MSADDEISGELKRLAVNLHAVKQRATELGMFTDDRELFECPLCGLIEDVTFEGLLVTYQRRELWVESKPPDTGLRFESVGDDKYRCPACQSLLIADLGD